MTPGDSRRGTRQGVDPVGRPRLPIRKDLGDQPVGTRVRGKLSADGLQCLHNLGLAASTARMGGWVFPIDQRQQGFLPPLPPSMRQDHWRHILADAWPPKVSQARPGRELCADCVHSPRTRRQLVVSRAGGAGIDSRRYTAFDLRRRRRQRGREVAWMERARAGVQGLPRRARRLFPSLPLGSTPPHVRVDRCAMRSRWGQPWVSRQALRGVGEGLVGVAHLPGQGERRARHAVRQKGKDLRPPQARTAVFGPRDEGAGALPDDVQALRAQGLESLVHSCLPRGVRAVVCDVLTQQLSRRHVLQDPQQAWHKRRVGASDALAHLAMGDAVLLPGRRRLSHRRLHHAPHPSSGRGRTAHRRGQPQTRQQRPERFHASPALEPKEREGGNDEAGAPTPALCGFPAPGLRVVVAAGYRLLQTRPAAFGQPRLLGQLANTVLGVRTQTRENP